MNIIFLDMDGVINSAETFKRISKDEEFKKLLNRLIDLCKNDDDNWGEFYK